MNPYWTVFQDTGDPLVWLLYRCQQAPAAARPPHSAEKEASPCQPPPIS